ncbi:MAG TPA: hypothetical protein VEM57_11375 [Candidatus Binatus sp.]|nr:hypothetical protein [Candidatus Binatus sp.]
MASGATVLRLWIDDDRTDAGNRRALVHHIAADDPAVALGDHGIEARVVEGHRQQPDRDLDARKVGGKPVLRI